MCVSGHFSDDVPAMQIRAPGRGSAAVSGGDGAAAERGQNLPPVKLLWVSGPMDNSLTGSSLSQWCATTEWDLRKTSLERNVCG